MPSPFTAGKGRERVANPRIPNSDPKGLTICPAICMSGKIWVFIKPPSPSSNTSVFPYQLVPFETDICVVLKWLHISHFIWFNLNVIKVTPRGSFLRKGHYSLKQSKYRLFIGVRTPSQPETAQARALAYLVLAESGSDAEMGMDTRQRLGGSTKALAGWVPTLAETSS